MIDLLNEIDEFLGGTRAPSYAPSTRAESQQQSYGTAPTAPDTFAQAGGYATPKPFSNEYGSLPTSSSSSTSTSSSYASKSKKSLPEGSFAKAGGYGNLPPFDAHLTEYTPLPMSSPPPGRSSLSPPSSSSSASTQSLSSPIPPASPNKKSAKQKVIILI
jgi:hypothetical protein